MIAIETLQNETHYCKPFNMKNITTNTALLRLQKKVNNSKDYYISLVRVYTFFNCPVI